MKQPEIISRVVRQLRGGSGAVLVETDPGRYFVAKFVNNPQGSRTLINEYICSMLMQAIGVRTPKMTTLKLSAELRRNLEGSLGSVGPLLPDLPGTLHLGSECEANPDEIALWDLLPRRLYNRVDNLEHFAVAFVVDRWLNQIDTRQAVFTRMAGSGKRYQASMIDHGFAFHGADWKLVQPSEVPLQGLYVDRVLYRLLDMPRICDETIVRIGALSSEEICSLPYELPECWFRVGDRLALQHLLTSLEEKRDFLPTLIKRDLERLSCLMSKMLSLKRFG